jgi:ankyrin repeat protein
MGYIHPPDSGTTPLHRAASLGRADIVSLLLRQDSINDALWDHQWRTCNDLASEKDVARVLEGDDFYVIFGWNATLNFFVDFHNLLNAHFRTLLCDYIHSSPYETPSPALPNLLTSPRVASLDLTYWMKTQGNPSSMKPLDVKTSNSLSGP